jgi:hypothetical protein
LKPAVNMPSFGKALWIKVFLRDPGRTAMRTQSFWRISAVTLLAGVAMLLVGTSAQAAAPAAKPPFELASFARSAAVVTAAPGSHCCYNPCIDYRHRGKRFCGPTAQTVLLVKDPTTCCCVEIPVCLPVCCLDDCAKVSSRCGLFGRGIVRHDYCCGVSVVVTFKKNGDIVVTYHT